MQQIASGEELDLVLTKLAVSEHAVQMLPIDGSSPGWRA